MNGKTIWIVIAITIGVFFAGFILELVLGMFTDAEVGIEDASDTGCDYQQDRFFADEASFDTLNSRCQTTESGSIDLRQAGENIDIVECLNNHMEASESSSGFVDACEDP